jgi:ribosomal-protein-alanine N-acetyltransferase
MSRPAPLLKTDRLVLRLPEPADVPAIVRYYSRNAEHFAPTDPPRPTAFLTPTFWYDQVRQARREQEAEMTLRLVLFRRMPGQDRGETEVVGTANFTQIVRGPLQACYLGYGLDRQAEGQGLMTEGLQAAIAHVFGTLGLHRIMANHLPDNARSAAVLQRLGFTVEGVAREYLFIRGAWRDHVLTSRVNPDWRG